MSLVSFLNNLFKYDGFVLIDSSSNKILKFDNSKISKYNISEVKKNIDKIKDLHPAQWLTGC